jgi:DNA-binding winged helix-turn-helix (wHTH) protein
VAPANPLARRVRFGLFELDLLTGELRKRGVKVHLQEQPFQVLAMLMGRAGDVVMREELRQRLWPEAVYVDFDLGLNKAVAKLRAALGDSADSPRFVETLERRGYRFIADVSAEDPLPAPAVPDSGSRRVVRLVWEHNSVALSDGHHVIGRDPASTIWIDSSVVSRRHASITISGEALSIEDHASRNGTFLNGRRLDGVNPLANGDEIRVGPARMVLRVTSPIEATDADRV